MSAADLDLHLATGTTTVCRAWTVTRRDGLVLGFTDHDRDILIDNVVHRAASGLTARALQQSTGLSVDNSEALGALSSVAISEVDLAAGRYDDAEVRISIVNWTDTNARAEIFRGTMGEVSRTGSAFRAELRGLAEALNQPVGLAYTRSCSAVLGDKRCSFDLSQPGYFTERPVEEVDAALAKFTFASFGGFDERWFEFGQFQVLTGAAAGLVGMVKSDRQVGAGREIELWQGVRATLVAGDMIRISAGCDKRTDTCRLKFANLVNFRGFPFMPGEDWLTTYPRSGQTTSGGSLQADT